MKKLIVALVMAAGFLGANAQTKIGYIDIDQVIAAMPEAEKASKELQDMQEELGKVYQDLEKEANDKSAQFVKDSVFYTTTKKEIVREEIIKLFTRLQGFNNEAQEKLKVAQQQKLQPIQQKAIEAVNAVAKKNGYAYVMDAGVLIVKPTGDDLFALVKKELGIKDAPATAPAKVPAKQ